MSETTYLRKLSGEDLQKHIHGGPLQVVHRLRRFFEVFGAIEQTDYCMCPLPADEGIEFFFLTENGKLAFDSLNNSIIVSKDGGIL